MRIPLLPGKFACNRGKEGHPICRIMAGFQQVECQFPAQPSSGICRRLQGKNRGQQGNCSGMSGGGAAPLLDRS
jgi:hypothetical protein